jgi:hypothetical protein
LSSLDEAGIKTAALVLYADEYRVWTYRLRSFWLPLRKFWNRLGRLVNHKIRRKVGQGAKGNGVWKDYVILPPFNDPSYHLEVFARGIKKPTPPRGLIPGVEFPLASGATKRESRVDSL